jgi:hypothetical protein
MKDAPGAHCLFFGMFKLHQVSDIWKVAKADSPDPVEGSTTKTVKGFLLCRGHSQPNGGNRPPDARKEGGKAEDAGNST